MSSKRVTFIARVDEWQDHDYNKGFSIELPSTLKVEDGQRLRVTACPICKPSKNPDQRVRVRRRQERER